MPCCHKNINFYLNNSDISKRENFSEWSANNKDNSCPFQSNKKVVKNYSKIFQVHRRWFTFGQKYKYKYFYYNYKKTNKL